MSQQSTINNQQIAIKVDNVSKTFKLPHEKTSSIKSALINFRKHRTYEKQEVLNDISFEVKKGEFFGIVGRNGSGKSTLLKLIAGIYTPDDGKIEINGRLTPFIELGVGFNMELTGRGNVFLNGALLGFSRKEMQAMYQGIVDFAELERFMDQKLKNYSSGMQVRLAFSIAIRAKSDILLIDEVLAVGDAAFQKKCFDYFYELKRKKATVCFISHDMSSVERFCDRALYLESGKIVAIDKAGLVAEIYRKKNERTDVENQSATSNELSLDTNDVHIEANIVNSQGKAIKNVASNEAIIVDVNVKAKKAIKEAVISFTIENENANTIVGTNTSALGGQLIDMDKTQTKHFQFQIENIFGEGNYVIDIEISTRDRSYVYGHKDEITKFKVVDYGQFPWLLRPKIILGDKNVKK